MNPFAPSAETYKLIAESADDILSLHSLDRRFLFVSPGGFRLTGFSASELRQIGDEIAHPEDRARVQEESREAALAGRVAVVQWRCRRKDGSFVWVETHTTVHHDDSGHPDFLICVSREVSRRREVEAALRASEARYRALADNFPNGVVGLVDRDRRLLVVGGAGLALAGLRPSDLEGKTIAEALPAEDARVMENAVDEALAGSQCTFEFTDSFVGHASLVSGAPVRDEDGVIRHALLTLQDVALLKETERALKESEGRFRALFERSPDGIVLLDPLDEVVPGRIIDCNPAFARMNGYARHELIGRPVSCLQAEPGPRDGDSKHFQYLRRVGEVTLTGVHRRKDGSIFPIETSTSIVSLGNRELVLGVDRDVSDRARAELVQRELTERLAYQATHDGLTGLPNRVLFEDRLLQAIEAASRAGGLVAVLFLDLDGFKRVNDSLGHECGDLLLMEVAARLNGVIRGGDTLSRRGGDEFLVLAVGLKHADDAVGVAQRLLDCLREPFSVAGHEIFAGASVGVSIFPDDATNVADLHRNADVAMYRAKALGRNRLECFEPTMNAAAQERLRREGDLRRALARGEFVVHYQPKADTRTLAPRSCEALVRWQHPQDGLLFPGAFLGVAEESGLIRDIDVLVLNTACRQAKEWRERGLPLERVAVNVSSLQFGRADLVEVVRDALAASSLEPSALELEVSESFAMKDVADTIAQFTSLRRLGVSLAMDDFGTGYSSLAHLQRLPFDTLKIDRSFIRPLGSDPASLVLVEAMTELAHKLGLHVVAEGVETRAQLEMLRGLGCELIQGYLTGRPMSAPDLERALMAAHPVAVGVN